MKFGKFLVESLLVPQNVIDDALLIQRRYKRKKLGRLLVELEHFSQKELNNTLFLYLKPNSEKSALELKNIISDTNPSKELSTISKKFKAIVLNESQEKIELISTVFNDSLLEDIEKMTHKTVLLWITSKEAFDFLLSSESEYFLPSKSLIVSRSLTEDEKLNENTPYSKLLKECICEAKKRNASDIHIEPTKESVDIRFRIYGIRRLWKTLSGDHKEGFISRVKWILNMDLGIVGRPQDSRASFEQYKLDIRANSVLITWGEKIVLRLLEKDRTFKIENTGFPKNTIKDLQQSVNKRSGLILLSGPTGSGKTTTLYSLLAALDRKAKNISTIENPVEYEFPGINQINIHDEGMSFATALRALMRQDPDVILVGEIRDEETADLYFKAASTGHLVLSTVHANGAEEVMERLRKLGVDNHSIESNLRLSVSQQLLARLCSHCSQAPPKLLGDDLVQFLNDKNIPISETDIHKMKVPNQSGCDKCDSGLSGRMLVAEYLKEDQIKEFLNNPHKPVLESTLLDQALIHARVGEINAHDLLEVA